MSSSTESVMLAEFYLSDDRALVFRVDPRKAEPEVDRVEIDARRLDVVVRALLSCLAVDLPGGPGVLASAEEWLTDPILTDLMRPVLRWAEPDAVIYLVPHGILHRVPLHAVPVDGVRLADRNPVVYSPSASVLRYCQANRRPGPRTDALVVADPSGPRPLTFGDAHESVLSGLFDSSVLRGDAATRRSLLERFGPGGDDEVPAILHATAHGIVEPTEIMRSGLELTDGRLSATDILTLRLPGCLVMLASCSTGISDARPGDELLGLIRALLHAGAPAVVVSLWDVDELSTSMLVGEFYRRLSSGEPAVRALSGSASWLRERTGEQVCGYAAEARRAAGPGSASAVRLALAEARIRWSIGDCPGAAEAADAALRAGPTSAERVAATRLRHKAAFAATRGGSPDLDRRIYRHPYFWAPFVLVGDWQ